jgi:hypothetical protein
MVAVGGSITAANYNSIKDSVDAVYDTLYGQTIRCADQVDDTTVEDDEHVNLFLDLTGTYVHQNDSLPALTPPATGQTIGADTSLAHDQSDGSQSAVANSAQMGYNDYEAVATSIEAFSFSVDADHLRFPDASFALGSSGGAGRSSDWGVAANNRILHHIATINFSSAARMDNWIESGGRIYLNPSLSGASGAKSLDWADLLSAIGTVKIDKCNTSADSGTVYRGLKDLTTNTYRLMFRKFGSGVYADNYYDVSGYFTTDKLRLKIRFVDGDTGTGGQGVDPGGDDDPIDETVNGTLSSDIATYDADSTFSYNSATYTAVDNSGPVRGTNITNIHTLGDADPQPQ